VLILQILFQADITQGIIAGVRPCQEGNLQSTIRVLVVDDYEPWANFVSAVAALNPEVNVVGQATDGLTALQKVVELKPDLVVLDIGLPDVCGIKLSQQILQLIPKCRILFLSANTDPAVVRAALLTGAQGYVVKSSAARDLMPALEAVLLDCYFVSAAANQFKPGEDPFFRRSCDA
jgi:DNA-binding NarL/FixJ family response regulator